MNRILFWAVLVFVVCLSGCGYVKIETGQTVEERTESADEQATRIRSQWNYRVSQTAERDLGMLVVQQFRHTTSVMSNYGNQISKLWREGEAGRGEQIEVLEMQQNVSNWVKPEQPILTAYEDVTYNGVERINQSSLYSTEQKEMFQELTTLYNTFYEVLFLLQTDLRTYDADRAYQQDQISRYLDELEQYAKGR